MLSLDLHHAPELHFVRDTVEEQGARVDQLLAEVAQELEHRDAVEESPEERTSDE